MMKARRKRSISNKLGLHESAYAKFVSVANQYACEVEVARGNKHVNGKSIMGIMMLAASKGTELEISTEGKDAEVALDAINDLINNRFGENE